MTLILTLGNREQVVQVSDRRVTVNGLLQDDDSDEHNKCGVINCKAGRLAYGFTGLAKSSRFETRKWLLDALLDCGPPDYSALGITDRLKDRATRDFRSKPELRSLQPAQKRLSILISGYLYNRTPPNLVYALLTNYVELDGSASSDAWEHFKCHYWSERSPLQENPALIQRVGFWPAIKDSELEELRSLLEEKRLTDAILGKALEVMRAAADRPEANGTIGKQLTSIVLPSDPYMRWTGTYHSEKLGPKVYLPDSIILESDERRNYARDICIEPINPNTSLLPMRTSKIPKNSPCPCGSGKRFCKCHGRHKPSDVPNPYSVLEKPNE
jgi:hypothetical protein